MLSLDFQVFAAERPRQLPFQGQSLLYRHPPFRISIHALMHYNMSSGLGPSA